MTVLAMTLPLARSSPIHIPRRDLVADMGGDLVLRLRIIADDKETAAPVNLTGATLQMLFWAAPTWRDYGLPYMTGRRALYTGTASVTDAAGGLATLTLAHDAGRFWPERLGYTLQMDLGASGRSALAYGALHLPRVAV